MTRGLEKPDKVNQSALARTFKEVRVLNESDFSIERFIRVGILA